MTGGVPRHPSYQHALLVHDTEEQLIEVTRAFVHRGLESGGDVLVHRPRARAARMRDALGSHPRLEYGLDEEMYRQPTGTLFAYQRQLAERSKTTPVWVTGAVPLGRDVADQSAWNRYESAVDEALGSFPFVALCTYDTSSRPDAVIAAAQATHRTVNVDLTERENQAYVEPADFLQEPLAGCPSTPAGPPAATMIVRDLDELMSARQLLGPWMIQRSAVSVEKIENVLIALNEVAANGLQHGGSPVWLTVWAGLGSLTCVVEDSGPGNLDPMTGYRFPDGPSHMGLWAARQLVDDLVIRDGDPGGCSVLLSVTESW